jgi:hypothetical protein
MADDQKKKVIGRGGRSGRGLDDQMLERELDMALAKYAAVEPRAGLEGRILANLKAEQEQAAARAWWNWPRAAAVVGAVVMIVAALLVWRPWNPGRDTASRHPSNRVQEGPRPQTGSSAGSERVRQEAVIPERRKRNHSSRVPVVVAAEPRLEQFPSPRPLSDQEKILASYVARYPEHAALVAQARAEALRRDAEEELETGQGGQSDSQRRSN